MKRDIIAADTMTVSVNIAVVKTDATVKTDEDVSVITDDVVNIAEAALIFDAVAVINTDHFVFPVIDTITPTGVAKVII